MRTKNVVISLFTYQEREAIRRLPWYYTSKDLLLQFLFKKKSKWPQNSTSLSWPCILYHFYCSTYLCLKIHEMWSDQIKTTPDCKFHFVGIWLISLDFGSYLKVKLWQFYELNQYLYLQVVMKLSLVLINDFKKYDTNYIMVNGV